MFPAGAGMNRVEVETLVVFADVPRRRGDEPDRHQAKRDVI